MSLETAQRYFDTLETCNAETIGETFHDEIVVWGPQGETHGKPNAVKHFAELYEHFPDTIFTPREYLVDETKGVAVEWEWKTTGPRGPIRIVGVDWMEFAEGKIRVLKFYYDPAPLHG